jgi:hypothetical protein
VPQPGRVEEFLAPEIGRLPAGEQPGHLFNVVPLGWRQIAKGLGTIGQTPPGGGAQIPYLQPPGGEYFPRHGAKRGGGQFRDTCVQLPVAHRLFRRRPALAGARAFATSLASALAGGGALAGAILPAPFRPAGLSRAAKGKAPRRRIVAPGDSLQESDRSRLPQHIEVPHQRQVFQNPLIGVEQRRAAGHHAPHKGSRHAGRRHAPFPQRNPRHDGRS